MDVVGGHVDGIVRQPMPDAHWPVFNNGRKPPSVNPPMPHGAVAANLATKIADAIQAKQIQHLPDDSGQVVVGKCQNMPKDIPIGCGQQVRHGARPKDPTCHVCQQDMAHLMTSKTPQCWKLYQHYDPAFCQSIAIIPSSLVGYYDCNHGMRFASGQLRKQANHLSLADFQSKYEGCQIRKVKMAITRKAVHQFAIWERLSKVSAMSYAVPKLGQNIFKHY